MKRCFVVGIALCVTQAMMGYYLLQHVNSSQNTKPFEPLSTNRSSHVATAQVLLLRGLQTKNNATSVRVGKERIFKLLAGAGINNIDDDTARQLPTWRQVVELYGAKPIIHGLQDSTTCQSFQTHSPKQNHFVSTAGMFNSGTNLMAQLLMANCQMVDRMAVYGKQNRGVRWQVPWGKHNPPNRSANGQHQVTKSINVTASDTLVAVTIRDPYVWMASMCRHPYGAHWIHDKLHCPNLIADEANVQQSKKEKWMILTQDKSVPILVDYGIGQERYDSLVHLWNEWYKEYMDVPNNIYRIIVRHEDLIFYPKEVTHAVCTCAGGKIKAHPFKFIVDTAKHAETAHGSNRTGWMDAMIRYGTAKKRALPFTTVDLDYAATHLDPNLMQIFGYHYPPKRK